MLPIFQGANKKGSFVWEKMAFSLAVRLAFGQGRFEWWRPKVRELFTLVF
jgi:hypothetical protein